MGTISDFLKNILVEALKEVASELAQPSPDPVKVTMPPIQIPPNVTADHIVAATTSISQAPSDRIINLGNGMYYAKGGKWTTWLNLPDWKGRTSLTLGSGSPHPTVTMDQVKGLRGISLSY